MVTLAAGLGMLRLWLGVAVFGLEIILMGMALAMGEKTPEAQLDEVL